VTDVRIYRPSKTAMQSGMRKTREWVVEFEPEAPPIVDPLMGWIGSADTQPQVQLRFDSRDEAIAYAARNGLTYRVIEPHQPIVRPKSYAENFRSSGDR
jgi:ETC complex I subunit conserved region